MTTQRARAALEAHGNTIKALTKEAEKLLLGRDAYLATSLRSCKYRGRLGKINGVLPSERHGIIALLMIYKHGTREFLNSEPYTRTYWPIAELRLDDE